MLPTHQFDVVESPIHHTHLILPILARRSPECNLRFIALLQRGNTRL
jgi:hypothetical protein